MNQKFVSNSNYVFRKILNSEAYLEILKNFIEAILNIKIEEIELNPYLIKKEKYLPSEEKFGIADVRIKTNENEEMNVGIQFIDGIYVQTKMLMYYSQIHLNQLEHDTKREFCRTITINILDFIYFSFENFSKKIKIECNEKYVKTEELEFNIIQLPKFQSDKLKKFEGKEQWVAYLKGDNQELIDRAKSENKYIKKLDDLLEDYWKQEKME